MDIDYAKAMSEQKKVATYDTKEEYFVCNSAEPSSNLFEFKLCTWSLKVSSMTMPSFEFHRSSL